MSLRARLRKLERATGGDAVLVVRIVTAWDEQTGAPEIGAACVVYGSRRSECLERAQGEGEGAFLARIGARAGVAPLVDLKGDALQL